MHVAAGKDRLTHFMRTSERESEHGGQIGHRGAPATRCVCMCVRISLALLMTDCLCGVRAGFEKVLNLPWYHHSGTHHPCTHSSGSSKTFLFPFHLSVKRSGRKPHRRNMKMLLMGGPQWKSSFLEVRQGAFLLQLASFHYLHTVFKSPSQILISLLYEV